MSLEQAIIENTAAIRDLIVALRTPDADIQAIAQHVAATAVAPEKVTQEPETVKQETKAPKPDAPPSSAPTQTVSASSDSSSNESKDSNGTEERQVEYKQIQQLVPLIAKTPEGTEMVKALFTRYGVKRGPELKPDQYDDFYADLCKVEAGEYDPRTAEV